MFDAKEECYGLLHAYPALTSMTRASDASQLLFGVKTLTSLVSRVNSTTPASLRAFFGQDTHSLTLWANEVTSWYYLCFYPTPDQTKVYKRMVTDFGLPVVAWFTVQRDWADMVTAYEFLKADPKRWAKFKRAVLSPLQAFPVPAQGAGIHDYAMAAMQREENKGRPTVVNRGRELPTVSMPATVTVDEVVYNVLVPTCEADLRKIGRAQGHCVGTERMGYADKVLRGEVRIFAIYRNTLADGVCLEVSARTGKILQVQGKHRRPPTQVESTIIGDLCNAS